MWKNSINQFVRSSRRRRIEIYEIRIKKIQKAQRKRIGDYIKSRGARGIIT